MVQFTILSDIHLEFIPAQIKDISKLTGENLLLCGDIGKLDSKIYKTFMNHCSTHFKRVFFICGNHEYYGYQMHRVEELCKKIETNYENVYYMHRRTIEFDDFIIIGATLWSNIPEDLHQYIKGAINDYRCIKLDKWVNVKPSDTNIFHRQDVEFIEKELDKFQSTKKPVVVMSHHAPLFDCVIPEYKTPKNYAFCTDLPQLWKAPVRLWAFGHTHCPFQRDIPIDETHELHFHNNPVGYPQELDKYECCKETNCSVTI